MEGVLGQNILGMLILLWKDYLAKKFTCNIKFQNLSIDKDKSQSWPHGKIDLKYLEKIKDIDTHFGDQIEHFS